MTVPRRNAAAESKFTLHDRNEVLRSEMTLRCDQRQRRLGIEPAVVERAAGDGARDHAIFGLHQRLDIRDAGKAARGDDGDGDGARQAPRWPAG